MRRGQLGHNGRRRRPRRPKAILPAPTPAIEPPKARTKLGPVTMQERVKHQAMLEEIEREKARWARWDEQEWARAQRYADEPMIEGSVVWHDQNVNGRGGR